MSSVWAKDAEQAVDEALALLRAVEAGDWEKAGAPGHGLLDATMRPIDDLTRDGVGWLQPYVQDLQDVLDRLAGNAAVIQHFARAWRDRATKVEQIRVTFADRVKVDTEQWKGDTADVYVRRAEEIRLAFEAAEYASKFNAELGTAVGAVVAKARGQARDQLAELVTQLISYAKAAISMEQGVTTNVMDGCLKLIASYRPGIFGIEEQVLRTLGVNQAQASTPAGPGTDPNTISEAGLGAPGPMANKNKNVWGRVRSIFARRGTERFRKEVDRVWRQRDRAKDSQERKDWRNYKQKNYRGSKYADELADVHGPPPQDGNMYQGHHNFPVKFGEKFEKMGIKTDNAAWGTWLEEGFHRQMTSKFEADWAKFFDARPNLSTADRQAAFDYLRKLADAHKYKLPF